MPGTRILILALALALAAPAAAQAAKPKRQYYVSLGDCEYRDIHARTSGYKLIAELIVKTLRRR